MTEPKLQICETPRRPVGSCSRCGSNEWEPIEGKPFERCLVCAREGVAMERFRVRR